MSDTTSGNRTNTIKRFLAWPSGALMSILARYPAEQNFYVALGTLVWLIAFLGCAGMMLNLRTTGWSAPAAFAGGAAWFLIILNLDRFLLMVRADSSGWINRAKVATRLVMALCIAIIVGESVVQYILRNEIRAELESQALGARSVNRNKALGGFPEVAGLRKELENKQADIREKNTEIAALRDASMKELDGSAASRTKGDGPLYKEKRATYDAAVREGERLEQELNDIQTRLDEKESQLHAALDPVNTAARNESGFLSNHRALMAVIRREPTAGILYGAISLVMVLIEITPLLAKVGRKRSIYETILTQQEETVLAIAEAQGEIQRRLLSKVVTDVYAAGPSTLLGQEAVVRESLLKRARCVIDVEMNRQNGVEPPAESSGPLMAITICIPGNDDFDVMFPTRPDLPAGTFVRALKALEPQLAAAGRPLIFANYTAVNDDRVEIDLDRQLLPQIGESRRVWFVPSAFSEVA